MYLRLTHSMADMIPLMWRLPHHFDPIQFSVKSWLVFGVLVIPGLIYLYTLRSRLFVPLVIALLGALLYALFYQIVPEIILTQWYKSMLWVKTIAGGATLIYDETIATIEGDKAEELSLHSINSPCIGCLERTINLGNMTYHWFIRK